MCDDHGPEWENLGEKRREPNPLFFGLITTWWFMRMVCCGKRMQRYKTIQKKRCKKCGREEDAPVNDLGVCTCCGHTHVIVHPHPAY